MTAAYQELADRIRSDIVELEHVATRAGQIWHASQKPDVNQGVYVDAAALNLHNFYSALEGLLTQIARHVDRTVPDGDMWHRALLEQMSSEVPGLRPAVIGAATARGLDEFRRFRHVVRHVYTVSLEPGKMAPLFAKLESLVSQLQAELAAFADYLDALAQAS